MHHRKPAKSSKKKSYDEALSSLAATLPVVHSKKAQYIYQDSKFLAFLSLLNVRFHPGWSGTEFKCCLPVTGDPRFMRISLVQISLLWFFKTFKLYCAYTISGSLFIRDHSSITSSKRWVGGVRKWQFSMIYSTVNHQRGGQA